jgi:hypothetical protein
MPIHKIISTVDTLTIYPSSNNSIVINKSDYGGTQAEIESAVLLDLQKALDAIIEKSELSEDDPDKTLDPKTKTEFWEGTKLRSRTLMVDRVLWPNKMKCWVKISRIN